MTIEHGGGLATADLSQREACCLKLQDSLQERLLQTKQ